MLTSLNPKVLLVALCGLFLVDARAQSFCWAQAINGISSISGAVVTIGTSDTVGNLYSIGAFGGSADFDRGPGVYSFTAVSNLDMFIMKEDHSGNLIWAKQVKGISGGGRGCFGREIDVDWNGNVFITGTFSDSFDFDPGPAVYKLNSFGSYHTFVLKLDSAGNFVWVKDIGTQISTVYVAANAAKRDKNGYLYFAALMPGNGTTSIDVDPGPGVYNITPGTSDLLLEKLDSNGNFVWAKVISGDNAKTPFSLDLDSASNIFISGKFLGSADFDPGPGVYNLTATPWVTFPNATDIFVAKYDSAGNFSWAHSFGSTSDDAANGGGVDRYGNVLVTGSFGLTVDFDPGPGVNNLTSAAIRSLFTLRLKNNGDLSWVKKGGGPVGSYYGGDVTSDSAGNVYTLIGVNGACDLDPGAGVFNVSSGAAIQKLDSFGNFVWGAGWQADEPRWIGLDNKDSVYVCGDFTGANKDFDPGPDTFLLSGNSNRSGFILKLNQILRQDTTTSINEASLQTQLSIYPNPSSGIVTFSSQVAIHRIAVTDVAGKPVYLAEPASDKMVVDLKGKSPGIYFYEADYGGRKQRGKLVIY